MPQYLERESPKLFIQTFVSTYFKLHVYVSPQQVKIVDPKRSSSSFSKRITETFF